ncbi:MAG: hypothetical protein JO257_37180 [Deltaproteobacteria bacterium]|nr:hypothetical protein [Deltaproteobacteria bacterium]
MALSRLVWLGLAACGAVSAPANNDAKTVDTTPMIDAPAPGPVNVVTQSRFSGGPPPGSPLGGIAVFAIRPDGTLADMQTTDASAATATLQAYDGDSVTALYPHMGDAGADLTTFMGVKHGDTLTFGLRFGLSSALVGSMNIAWPAIANTNYVVYTDCGGYGFGTATSGSISEYTYCHRDPMDVMIVARDATTSIVTQAGLIPAVAFQNGGTATLQNWHAATSTKSLQITGLPSEVTNVSMSQFEVISGNAAFSFGAGGAPSNGQFTSSAFQWPGQATLEWTRIFLMRQGNWAQMGIFDNTAPTIQPYSITAPALPPWMTTNYVFSAAAQMMAWFPVGTGPQKGTILRVNWSHNGVPYSWSFVVPPGVTALTFPKLPDAVAMNAPHLEDTGGVNYVRTFDIPELAGYDDVRKLPEMTLTGLDIAVEAGQLKRVIQNF